MARLPSETHDGQMPESPETVAEALALLAADGYAEDYNLQGHAVTCPGCQGVHDLESVVVERQYRFEGPSDPADEAIVLGLHCVSCGSRGVLVSAFGPDTDPGLIELLRRL